MIGNSLNYAVNNVNVLALNIIEGNTFSAGDYDDLANQEVVDYVVRTKSNTDKFPSVAFTIISGYQVQLEYYEDSTESGGSTINSFNNNRLSPVTAETIIVKNPTVTDVGTLINSKRIGFTGRGGDTSIGVSATIFPTLLKKGISYLIRVTSLASSNQITADAFITETDTIQ